MSGRGDGEGDMTTMKTGGRRARGSGAGTDAAADSCGPGGAGQGCPGGGAAGVACRVRARRGAGSGGVVVGPGEPRGCRSWCRSGMGGCWSRRSRSTGGRRCRWRRTCPGHRRRGCGSSCAGMLTCRISARSRRRSGSWSSTSTTSTRRFPGRSSGMSSGWRRAWPWPAGTTGSRPRTGGRSSSRRHRATGSRCARSRTSP